MKQVRQTYMTDAEFISIVQSCKSYTAIRNAIQSRGYSASIVAAQKRIAKLGIDISHFPRKPDKRTVAGAKAIQAKWVYALPEEEFKEIASQVISYSMFSRATGHANVTSNATNAAIRRRAASLGVDLSHFQYGAGKPDNVLVNGSQMYITNGVHLKRMILDHGILENKCANCGIEDWDGFPIDMIVFRKNGVKTDLRIENLMMVCPNCYTILTEGCRSAATKKGHEKRREAERLRLYRELAR